MSVGNVTKAMPNRARSSQGRWILRLYQLLKALTASHEAQMVSTPPRHLSSTAGEMGAVPYLGHFLEKKEASLSIALTVSTVRLVPTAESPPRVAEEP